MHGMRHRMIRVVTKDNAERHVGNLYQMHRIRKAVFKDRLGWDVTVSGELEVDEYDALGPGCLLSIDRQGYVNVCVRPLPTPKSGGPFGTPASRIRTLGGVPTCFL